MGGRLITENATEDRQLKTQLIAENRELRTVQVLYRTVDAQVAGEAVRLVVEGAPAVKGRSMAEKAAWFRKHGELLRECLMLEPRGHAGMHGALFTEPASPSAHAGLLFMNAAGFPQISGEAAMAASMIGLEERILHVDSDRLRLDTPAGVLTTEVDLAERTVTVEGLAGYVQAAAVPVQLGGRTARADVAFGGESYVILDSEAAGVSVDVERAPELVRTAARIVSAFDQTRNVIFTAPARADGHLRTATVLEGGLLRRAPGVTGTVALMAVLDAMGILEENQPFINEGLVGTSIEAKVLRHAALDEKTTIAACVKGAVSITGRHDFVGDASPRFRI
jgi:proline racemase